MDRATESTKPALRSYRLEVICECLDGGNSLHRFGDTMNCTKEGFSALVVLKEASRQFAREGVFGKNVWYPPWQIRSIRIEEVERTE